MSIHTCKYCSTTISNQHEQQVVCNTINSIVHNIDISNIMSQYSYQLNTCNLFGCNHCICINCYSEHYDPTMCTNCTLCKYVVYTH